MSGATGDPRERDDGLGWVTRAVFPDERVWLRVSREDHDPPPGIVVAARFVVAPSVGRARFLLPVASRRVTAASVLAYNALRRPRVRAARTAVGALARLGATRLARMPILRVGLPSGSDRRELLLVDHLAGQLGERRLHAAIGVPTPDPNYKPTLQLFDGVGKPRGYAKIGWNRATRALVRTELRALSALAGTGDGHPYVPRLLAGGEWAGYAVALIEPLPPAVARIPGSAPPRLPELLAVARRGGTRRGRFGESSFVAGLLEQAAEAASDCGDRVARAARALRDRDHDTVVEFGAWHGDWVPWNLGRLPGDRLVAWDWEHSGVGVPVGFDLAHQGFQTALILAGADAAGAAGTAARLVERYGGGLGLDARQRRLVVDAYLVELWLRTRRLASAGAGWNPALHPALLSLLERRI